MTEHEFSPEHERLCLGKYKIDNEGFVDLGDIARGELGRQKQYISLYVGGYGGRPDLSIGLRFNGDARIYHELRIHADDVEEFIHRVREQRGE